MSRLDWGHGLAFALALLAAAAVGVGADPVAVGAAPVGSGGPRRIVSTSLVADGILAEIAEPERVVATTSWLDDHPRGWRLGAARRVDGLGDLEAILALRPDLVVVSAGDPARVARLRDAGVEVIDHGPVGGRDALYAAIDALAARLEAPERGAALRRSLDARRAAIGPSTGRRGMYVAAVGAGLWGGAAGTSYHDVLLDAGLRDVAAEAGLTGWPALRIEQLVTLDPEVVVGEPGTRDALCARPELTGLAACQGDGVIELPAKLVSDPGPAMVDAAEALRAAIDQPAASRSVRPVRPVRQASEQ